MHWIRQETVRAGALDEPLHRWVIWADEVEKERLRVYHQHAIGDEFRRCWTNEQLSSSPNGAIIPVQHERKKQRQPARNKKLLLWVVCLGIERTFAWTTRFRRLVRDYERLPGTLSFLAFGRLNHLPFPFGVSCGSGEKERVERA